MGGGWAQTSYDPDLGTLSLWGEAPEGAITVRLSLRGEIIVVSVTNGAYLVVRFNVPEPPVWPGQQFVMAES